jgi:predicted transcriptional regulator
MRVLDVYDTMMEEIQSIFRSRLQLQILLSLLEGNKTLADLREITGSTSQAIIPKIRILEASRYIGAVDYEYYLTTSGRVITTKIQDYMSWQQRSSIATATFLLTTTCKVSPLTFS